jgi:lysophospholipase L1-like esterase
MSEASRRLETTASLATSRRTFAVLATIGLTLAALAPSTWVGAQSGSRAEHWVGTWATAVVSSQQVVTLPAFMRQRNAPPPPASGAAPPPPPLPPPGLQVINNQTLREIVHTSLGGSRFRVVFTNEFGTKPLKIGASHIALRAAEAAIAASGASLMFAGQPAVTIPIGARMVSDPVSFTAPPFADLAIDAYVSDDTTGSPLTLHGAAVQTSYLSEAGNHSGQTPFPVARQISSWYLLSRVEVVAPPSVGAVITFGDSITDGTASTANANHRWPDDLARRLASMAGGPMGVLNLGIAGNRLLSDGLGVSALARFDRDVTSQSGVTGMTVLEAINDIGFAGEDASPTAAELIAAHQQIIARAHVRGLKVFGATLTPFEGAMYQTAVGEAKRQEVNKWIRTSGAYDGVIDFEAVVRDPDHQARTRAAFDPGDHLHFTDAGYQAMADAIELSLFKRPGR